MILYKTKPKKMFIGGLVSLASSVSDWIGGSDETDKWAQTGSNIIDPFGTAMDTIFNDDASSEEKWTAGLNAVMPSPGASYEGAEMEVNRVEDQQAADKQKKKDAKYRQLSETTRSNAAQQYTDSMNADTAVEAPTQQAPTTTKANNWYYYQ